MFKKYKSILFVTVQFIMIFAIVLYCGVTGGFAQNLITGIAVILGVWAIATMKFSVNIFPDVRKGQRLFISGPYKYIRHPMYTAVLLSTAAWVSNRLDFISIFLWLILLTDLIIKLHYEEKLLKKKFIDYKEYMTKTKRLIPKLF